MPSMSSSLPMVPEATRRRQPSWKALGVLSDISVSMKPGRMALTWMPFGPSSIASERTRPVTAALVMQ